MALTAERLRTTTAPDVRRKPDAVDRRTAFTLLASWLLLYPIAYALEPAPASNAPEPWWAVVAGLGLLVAMGVAFAGLVRRQRFGVTASLIGSLIFAAGVFACPTTGHHAFGLWWIGEFAASLAVVGLSTRAYFRAAR